MNTIETPSELSRFDIGYEYTIDFDFLKLIGQYKAKRRQRVAEHQDNDSTSLTSFLKRPSFRQSK